MKAKLFLVPLFVLTALLWPSQAFAAGEEKAKSLKDLQGLLKGSYDDMEKNSQLYMEDFALTCQDLREAIDENEDLKIRLFNQNPSFTLNVSWLLKSISDARKRFLSLHSHYKQDHQYFDDEIDRYERLRQSLQQRASDSTLQENLDSCIFYVNGILDYYSVIRDSLASRDKAFEEADSLINEANEYVQMRYQSLQDYVFIEGQDAWPQIIQNTDYYKDVLHLELASQYDIHELVEGVQDYDSHQEDLPELGYKAENSLLFYIGSVLAGSLIPFLLLFALLTCLCARIFRINKKYKTIQIFTFGLLLGCVVFLFILDFRSRSYVLFMVGTYRILRHFVSMLTLILASLLFRVKVQHLKASLLIYLPTIFMALVVFLFRICFMPDLLITLILAPVLIVVCILQLTASLVNSRRVDRSDACLGWISLGISIAALVTAILGYTFVSMLILIFWYFEMTILLCVLCLTHLTHTYQEKRMNPRIEKYQARVAAITGLQKKSIKFKYTWFSDLMTGVLLPVIFILSLPFCLQLTLRVFDFDALFHSLFVNPFIHLTDNDGSVFFTLSFRSLVQLSILFCLARYLNKMIHFLWQSYRYGQFRRKHHRTAMRSNEISLSLDNSIISVIIWFLYIAIFVNTLKIPIGSLTMIAGGLSAGIGLAMKDVINNFFCGIQLVGGRLRVGDYIECDGVRGKVLSIGYQSTQILTRDDTVMIFTNSTLFNKNYKNLSLGGAYERIKVFFPLGYGTDIEKVRTLLMDAIKTLQAKDKFHRDILDPTRDTRITVYDFGERGVEIALFQHVLVEERGRYLGKMRELIYKTLIDNGIHIPAHQIEVQLNPESSPEDNSSNHSS